MRLKAKQKKRLVCCSQRKYFKSISKIQKSEENLKKGIKMQLGSWDTCTKQQNKRSFQRRKDFNLVIRNN
jgi:hypothetical protein